MNLVGFLKKPRLVANPQADAAAAWGKVVELEGVLTKAAVPISATSSPPYRGSGRPWRGGRGDRTRPPEYSAADVRSDLREVTSVLGSAEDMAALAPGERHAYVDTLDRFAGGDRTVSADPSLGERAAARLDHQLGADRGSHAVVSRSRPR